MPGMTTEQRDELVELGNAFRAEAASASEDVLAAFPAAIDALGVLLDAAGAYNAVMPSRGGLAPAALAMTRVDHTLGRAWPVARLAVDKIVAEVVAAATGDTRRAPRLPVSEVLTTALAVAGPAGS